MKLTLRIILESVYAFLRLLSASKIPTHIPLNLKTDKSLSFLSLFLTTEMLNL